MAAFGYCRQPGAPVFFAPVFGKKTGAGAKIVFCIEIWQTKNTCRCAAGLQNDRCFLVENVFLRPATDAAILHGAYLAFYDFFGVGALVATGYDGFHLLAALFFYRKLYGLCGGLGAQVIHAGF